MAMSMAEQFRQRTTVPGPRRQTAVSATGPAAPQVAHVASASVMSVPNTSCSRPPIELPYQSGPGLHTRSGSPFLGARIVNVASGAGRDRRG